MAAYLVLLSFFKKLSTIKTEYCLQESYKFGGGRGSGYVVSGGVEVCHVMNPHNRELIVL